MHRFWKEYKKCPFTLPSDPILVENKIFITKARFKDGDDSHGIWYWNVDKNEWILSMPLTPFQAIYNKIICDDDQKKIIMINDNNIFKMDPSNQELNVVENRIFPGDEIPNIIHHQHALHSIVTSEENWHELIEDDYATATLLETGAIFDEFEDGLKGHRLISVGGNIYLFGGFISEKGVWSKEIFKYNRNDGWNHLSVASPEGLSTFGCIATNDSKFILIFGGMSDNGLKDDILIFDIDLNIFTRSDIKCPVQGRYGAIAVSYKDKRDEKAVFGFVRYIYGHPSMQNMQMMPHYLLKIIDAFYAAEYVHLINIESGKHFGIALPEIFLSSTPSLPTDELCRFCLQINLKHIRHNHCCPESMNICSICDQQFADFDSVVAHKKNHAPNKFDCALVGCTKHNDGGYKGNEDLVKHMKREHGAIYQETQNNENKND